MNVTSKSGGEVAPHITSAVTSATADFHEGAKLIPVRAYARSVAIPEVSDCQEWSVAMPDSLYRVGFRVAPLHDHTRDT